jgi:glycosyltransferase involved in cell wall biosynthesis
MRIIHVTKSSDSDNFLGHERHVLNLAIAQKARGTTNMVMVNEPGVLADACKEHAIPVVVVRGLEKGGMAQPPAEATMQDLTAEFKSFRPDLVHCHHPRIAAEIISTANRMNLPCVLTMHIAASGMILHLNSARRLGLKFSTIAVARADFEYLKMNGFGENEVFYVPNGSNIPTAVSTCESTPAHRPNLMLVAALMFRKGTDAAIMAMVELRRRLGADCPSLSIYGEGQQREYFEEMVHLLQLDDIVRFCGFQLDNLQHCCSADVLVMPSREETGPLVVQEAMSRGMPIVATDVGEVCEMLPDRRYGRVVPPNSAIKLADAIESLLADIAAGCFDPREPLERYRRHFTIERMAERTQVVYESVLLNARFPSAGSTGRRNTAGNLPFSRLP